MMCVRAQELNRTYTDLQLKASVAAREASDREKNLQKGLDDHSAQLKGTQAEVSAATRRAEDADSARRSALKDLGAPCSEANKPFCEGPRCLSPAQASAS